ncbi:MAG: outer membrane beta-barrel protein [Micropepsaceae bacterium]
MDKHFLLATVASIASFALVLPASAASFTGWYGGVEAGGNWVSDADGVNDTIDFGGYTNTSEFDGGWAILGNVGYSFGAYRTELELGYRTNDLDKFVVTGDPYSDGGDISQFTVMANALYDFKVAEHYDLTLGAGIGIDSVDYDNSAGWHTVDIKDSDTVFAWQLIAGVSRYVPEWGADVVLNYRYLQTDSVEFRESDGADLHNDKYDNLDNHTVSLGLRWH